MYSFWHEMESVLASQPVSQDVVLLKIGQRSYSDDRSIGYRKECLPSPGSRLSERYIKDIDLRVFHCVGTIGKGL